MIFCGDFNSHNPLWGSKNINRNGKNVEHFILNNNLYLLNDGSPTRIDLGNGALSCLDLTLSTPSLASKCSWAVCNTTLGSDHFLIEIKIQISPPNTPITTPSTTISQLAIHKANWKLYKCILQNMKLEDVYDENTQTLYDNFMAKIIDAANAAIPPKKSNSLKTPIPWWSKLCSVAVAERNKANTVFRKLLKMDDLLEFKKKKAEAQLCIRRAKKEYWEHFCSTLNRFTPLTKIWKKVKSITHPQSNAIQYKISSNWKVLNDDSEKANRFAEYYSDIQTKLVNQHDTQPRVTPINNDDISKVLNEPITIDELNEIINITPNTSSGPDGINSSYITKLPSNCINILVFILNRIWTNPSSIPLQWKASHIIPILKPSKTQAELSSYRPVSLTSVIGKIMERIISKRLSWHCNKYNIISPLQSGFTEKRSVIDNIAILDTDIHKAIVSNNYVLAIFLDIEKAFDSVRSDIITNKLVNYGFSGSILQY